LIDPKLKKTVEEEVEEIAHDLPIEINDRVLGFLDYYQSRGRGSDRIRPRARRSLPADDRKNIEGRGRPA
jgi:hypothetical protein